MAFATEARLRVVPICWYARAVINRDPALSAALKSFSCLHTFHPAIERWFTSALGDPTAAQAAGWDAIRAAAHPDRRADRVGQDAGGVSDRARRSAARRRRRGRLPDETRVVYISPLKALSSDIHKNLIEPRARHSTAGGRDGARGAGDHLGGANRRHHAGRARGHGADAAAHPGHDAGIVLPAADLGAEPRAPAPRAHGDRRRDPRGDRHQARRAPGAVARAARLADRSRHRFASACRQRSARSRMSRGSWWARDDTRLARRPLPTAP